MYDIWGFLLQTLTASGAAALLLIVKALFRDKLAPLWQFSMWAILAFVLLLPASLFGRYHVIQWPLLVELLKTVLSGEYTLTQTVIGLPFFHFFIPDTAAGWLFFVYEWGVIFFLIRYVTAYIRLRLLLLKGTPLSSPETDKIQNTARRYDLPACPAVCVPGISSAFIAGILRPVLAVPQNQTLDEKIILHELLHLKYKDTVWGVVICIFRCIHWCNPLLWRCADLAGNDLEALCDYRVLERLKGEERRAYGNILLAMADETYARMPGTSSAANGARNISRRIRPGSMVHHSPGSPGHLLQSHTHRQPHLPRPVRAPQFP